MGRSPCSSKVGLHKGPWTSREDTLLVNYIQAHDEGLLRCGKSCRLRWMNYLRPDIKRGNISPDEDDLIIRLHSLLGNRWSLIAGRLPGRTDNEIKNYWNTHLSKRLLSQGIDPNTTRHYQSQGSNNKQNPKKANATHEPAVIPKLHLPKPSRITTVFLPRNDSFDQCTMSSSQRGEGALDSEVIQCPWSEYVNDGENGSGLLSDLECHSGLPASEDENSLEKLYEEYLQLLRTDEDQLQLDDFAESFLI
ncbi:hypothetical protein CXB51_019553 [Gossypium anomalum]|uniref:Uncharacterized protein n=1 Tax=Gossypium anomalum TaxID=47600 RepID=A0A8J6CVM4_9ROSI|nr:hypothetical protein CXB51_019553 [Gossypium anomalum]